MSRHPEFDAFRARVLRDHPRVRFWYYVAKLRWHLWRRWTR